jgi:hypothetical protein
LAGACGQRAVANQALSADAAHGVLASDTDTNPTDHLFVSAVDGLAGDVNQPIAGTYGTLTLHADGNCPDAFGGRTTSSEALPPSQAHFGRPARRSSEFRRREHLPAKA